KCDITYRSENTLRFPRAAPEPSTYRTYDVSVEYPRSLSGAKYIFVRKSVFFGYELKLLISTAGGRFHFITVQGQHLFKETTFTVSTLPRAWLEPPRSLCSLRGLKAHGTALSFVPPKTFCYSRKCFRWDEQCAVPGVAAFR